MRLLSILTAVFLLILPLLVAWGMTWEWTSFAYGTADGWLGFWGGYIGTIIGALTAGIIAYYVAHRQINLQVEKDNIRERQFLATQLNIEKNQEAYTLLLDLTREFAVYRHSTLLYAHSKIRLEELREKENQCQNNIMLIMRKLTILEPFVDGLREVSDEITKRHLKMGNIIYDGYTYPNNKNKIEEDTSLETLKNTSNKLIDYVMDYCEKINGLLKSELDNLKGNK